MHSERAVTRPVTIGLSSTTTNGLLNPIPRAQSEGRVGGYGVGRVEFDLKLPGQSGQGDRHFHGCELITDATPRTSAEREIGVRMSTYRSFGREPVGVEALGVRPEIRTVMRDPL